MNSGILGTKRYFFGGCEITAEQFESLELYDQLECTICVTAKNCSGRRLEGGTIVWWGNPTHEVTGPVNAQDSHQLWGDEFAVVWGDSPIEPGEVFLGCVRGKCTIKIKP